MAWIESHQQLRDHPKVLRLSRLLDVHRTSAVGLLHFLWWWALDHAEDGDVTDFDHLDLALAAGWEGDPDQFVKALHDCGPGDRNGFLARDGDRLVLHDWWDYAGKLVDRRVKDRERKKAERETSTTPPQDVQRTSDGTPTVQNRTQPDPTEPKDKARKRAHQLPDDWKPNENHRKLASDLGIDADDQAERFKDHHVAKGSTFKDWDRAFNNWLRRARDYGTTGPSRASPDTPRRRELEVGSPEWEAEQQARRELAESLTGGG